MPVETRERERAKNRGMDARNAPARRSGMSLLEGLYRVVMRRTPIYVTFVVVGAFLAEQAVDKGVHKLWEYNNAGKRFQDIPVLGTRQLEE